MKKIVIALTMFLGIAYSYGQTVEDLKAEQSAKKDSIAAIQGRVDAIQGQIDAIPGWKIGAFGTVGASISGADNWYSKGTPNQSAGNIGINFNGFANLDREKFFWKNKTNINLGWVKLDDKDDPNDNDNFESSTDIFTLTSLYGYKLSKQFAASALGEYRTSIIDNFNNPGYLDLGIGATWTPIENLVVVIHPLNYNIVFSDEGDIYDSSLGTKIVADYNKKWGALKYNTTLSAFISYKGSDYSNWSWINSLGYTFWKNIGAGFDFGLRQSKQEALDYNLNTIGDATATFDNVDNKLQTYWLFGLNYNF